jgi:hypothetical protein
MLRPEKQGLELFAAGIDAIVDAQRRVALLYFEDGSVEAACPPLKALLHVMAHGHFEGMRLDDPELRRLFDRDALFESDWYQERLRVKQQRDVAMWRRHLAALEEFCRGNSMAGETLPFDPDERVSWAHAQFTRASASTYLRELRGPIGADPFQGQAKEKA